MSRTIRAFEPAEIHAGNRGLGNDHDSVAGAVEKLLGRMSLEQKIHEIHGWQPSAIEGLYYAGGDESLGIPSFRMVDGPRGARTGTATAFPVAIARGASFDVALERRVGLAIGLEVAAKGGNVLLAPTINLLRHPGWGRAQETYSEDSFHMGAMASAFIGGAQNHVLTSPKHFAANNLENTRFEMSANMDLRTLHEVYLPHFRRCVQEAGAASIMSSYNQLNGIYCSEDPYLLTEVLRTRWGFKGFVESDWFLGTRSTTESLRAGMDIEMPAAYRRAAEKLKDALEAGEIGEQDIEIAAAHALYQKIAWDLNNLPVPDAGVVECAEHVSLAREVAEKSIVLLKNSPAMLPMADQPGLKLAVVGNLADMVNLGDRGSSMVTSSETTSPLAGIRELVQQAEVVHLAEDADLSVLSEFTAAVIVTGLTYKEEGEFIPTAQIETEQSELARGGDRSDLKLPDSQRDLIRRVTAAAPRTIVVLEGGSAIEVDDWLDDVDALLMAWYPGREGGRAIARVLFGEVNPSGALPVSFPRSASHLMDWDVTALDVQHDLLHGYRYLDQHQHAARFPFGFGLSYTSFKADDLHIERNGSGFLLRVRVINAGDVAGACILQAYVGYPDSAVDRVPKELKQFARVELDSGESASVELPIDDSQLCYFDTGSDDFVLENCGYRFLIGFSADNLPLTAQWNLTDADWQAQDD